MLFYIPLSLNVWSMNLWLMLKNFVPHSVTSYHIDYFICLIDCYMHHMFWNNYHVVVIIPTLPKVSDQKIVNHWGVICSLSNLLNAFGALDEFKVCVEFAWVGKLFILWGRE